MERLSGSATSLSRPSAKPSRPGARSTKSWRTSSTSSASKGPRRSFSSSARASGPSTASGTWPTGRLKGRHGHLLHRALRLGRVLEPVHPDRHPRTCQGGSPADVRGPAPCASAGRGDAEAGRTGPRRRPGRHRDRRRRRAERGEPSGPRPGTRHRGGALPRSDEQDPAGGGDAHDPSSPYGVSGRRRPLGGRPVPGDARRGRAPERLAPGFARDLASCLQIKFTFPKLQTWRARCPPYLF